MDSVALILGSSNNTADVAAHSCAAIARFWADCPYQKFIALSTADCPLRPDGWTCLYAGHNRGWRAELSDNLRQLSEEYRHVILLLDDFILTSRVESEHLRSLIEQATAAKACYVRLVPVERPIWSRRQVSNSQSFAAISDDEPYYSSLQAAVWSSDHLLAMLAMNGNIWDFEHQRISGHTHFAVTRPRYLQYQHVVEKGLWMPYARTLFAKAGIPFKPGSRPMLGVRYWARHLARRWRFKLVGYSILRLRRRLAPASLNR